VGAVFRIAQEEHLQRHQLLETRRIAKCYLNYISNHRDRVQPLFELLTVVSHKTRCDYTFVKDFYVDLVADKYTVEEKKKVSLVHLACVTPTVLDAWNLDRTRHVLL